MALKLDLLNTATAIIDRKTGKPTPQLILFWQRTARAIEGNEASQEELLELIQQQQLLILQLLEVVAQNVVYLNDVSAYLALQATATIQRGAYTQCAVGTVATATGTDISACGDPSDFPPWPTPPPSPWEDPGP